MRRCTAGMQSARNGRFAEDAPNKALHRGREGPRQGGPCLAIHHLCFVEETPDANLSKGMRQLNGVYTK